MPPAPRGQPNLRTYLRWRIQDVFDRFVGAGGIVREPAKFEEYLCEAMEVLLTNHRIDIHAPITNVPRKEDPHGQDQG